MSKNLLASCFIKEGKFKPKALGGNTEITIRELTIDENQELRRKFAEEEQKDAILFAVKCSMVNPAFFSEEDLKKLNATGAALINEIFTEIPVIGKTKEEREEHFQALADLSKKQNEINTEEESEDIGKK